MCISHKIEQILIDENGDQYEGVKAIEEMELLFGKCKFEMITWCSVCGIEWVTEYNPEN